MLDDLSKSNLDLQNEFQLCSRTVKAVLVICGLGIHDFDYSRTRKQGKTANYEGSFANSSLKRGFSET